MKVKFISNNPHYYYPQSSDKHSKRGEWCVINSAYFALRHWYNLYGQHSIEWQMPEIVATRSAEAQLSALDQDPPDVLALAVFVWNEQTQHWLAREFKRRHPNSTVIMGGPQLTAHRNQDFFDRYPYVDWAVYGDGERPFQQIIDSLCDPNSVSTTDIRNAVSRVRGVYHCYPYEMMEDHLYLSTSMWLNQADEIQRVVQYLNGEGIPTRYLKFTVEFARGCMYNCTFCDWSQNLTKKVKRRRHDWKEEIDLFHRLDIPLRESDANFGQWDEDLKIFEYANSLYDPARNFYFIPKNTPKIKRSSILYIMRRCYEVYGNSNDYQEWAIQDPNPQVLKSVDRPSIPFDELCKMVQELNRTVQMDISDLHTAQLIVSLSSQSIDSWTDSIQKLWNDAGIKCFSAQAWELLPNSPGYKKEYRDLHNIQSTSVYMANRPHSTDAQSLDDLYQQCATNRTVNHWYSSATFVTSTATMSHVESIAATKLIQLVERYRDIKKTNNFKISDYEMLRLKQRSIQESQQIYDTIQSYIKKYGFMMVGEYKDGKILPSALPLLPW